MNSALGVSHNASGTGLLVCALLSSRSPPVDQVVTFITVFPMLGWIHADVAGHTLEGFLTAAGAVAADTIETLHKKHGSTRD